MKILNIKKCYLIAICLVLIVGIIALNKIAYSGFFNGFIVNSFKEEISAYTDEFHKFNNDNSIDPEKKIQIYEDYIKNIPATHFKNRYAPLKIEVYKNYLKYFTKNKKKVPDEKMIKKFLELAPAAYEVYLIAGDYYNSVEEQQKAYETYKQAFLLYPYNEYGYLKMIDSFKKTKDFSGKLLGEYEDIFRSIKKNLIRIYFSEDGVVFDPANLAMGEYVYFNEGKEIDLRFELKSYDFLKNLKTIKSIRINPVSRSFLGFQLNEISLTSDENEIFKIKDFSQNVALPSTGIKPISKNSLYIENPEAFFVINNINIDIDHAGELVLKFKIFDL